MNGIRKKLAQIILTPDAIDKISMLLETKVELSSEKKLAVLRIQTVALSAVHEFFTKEEYYQLMPIILSPITDPLGPDPGSTVIKTGEIEYQGQMLQLTQSMILQKQIAIGKGIDKFYIMSPNVRLESEARQSSGIHAFEFTQIDFELKEGSMKDIFHLVEKLLRYIKKMVELKAGLELKLLDRQLSKWEEPFPIYETHELIELYGDDWEKLSSTSEKTPYWVICHDREFYDKQDHQLPGRHFFNYDLYYPEGYLEALSGAEREYQYEHLKKRIEHDGFSLSTYSSYIDLAKTGQLSASAGGGLGVERLIRYLCGLDHIQDVQVFPRIPGVKVVY